MGSFDSGFRMGQGAYQQSIDNDRQKVKDDRDQVDFQTRQDEVAYQKAQRLSVDNAFTAQQGLQTNGKFMGGNTSGLTDDSARMLYGSGGQKALDDTASYANVENRRFGLDTGYTTSMAAQQGAKAVPTVQSRPASPLEVEQGFGQIAAAQKDAAGMRSSQQNQLKLQYDSDYTKHITDWGAMAGPEKAALIKKLSDDTGVRGNANWTEGKGKMAGYMTFLPPTGDAMRLSDKEAGQVYALTNLMQLDPGRARIEMENASDKVAKMASTVFEDQIKASKVNNDAFSHAAVNENGRISANASVVSAGAAATSARATANYYGAKTNQVQEETSLRDSAAKAIRPFVDQFNALSPDEQSGPRGLQLQKSAALAAANNSKDINGTLQAMHLNAKPPNNAKFEMDNIWSEAEKKLMGSNTPPKEIAAQRDSFYASRGFAPQSELETLVSGRHPVTNDLLTEQNVDAFNAKFPYTTVDKSKLPWLQPKAPPAGDKRGGLFPASKDEAAARREAVGKSIRGMDLSGAFTGMSR